MTTAATEYVYPVHRVGEQVAQGVQVYRTDYSPGGSQTIWTTVCPDWCRGHNPDEVVCSEADEAGFDWSEHIGPDSGVRLPGLSDRNGVAFRDWGLAHVETWQIGAQPAMVVLDNRGPLHLTPSEARSLAALLLRTADTLEA